MHKLKFSMRFMILVTGLSALVFTWYPTRWSKERAIAVLRSFEHEARVICFARTRWAWQHNELKKFAAFERLVRKLPKGRWLRIEVIDVTDVPNSENPMVNWRGYNFSEHKIQGYGEAFWVERGQIVHTVRFIQEDAIESALDFTTSWIAK